jgi:hypothetical protein
MHDLKAVPGIGFQTGGRRKPASVEMIVRRMRAEEFFTSQHSQNGNTAHGVLVLPAP